MKITARKPTPSDAMLHRFLKFWKNSGVEPEFPVKYTRRKFIDPEKK